MDHICGDSTLHSSRQTKRSINHGSLLTSSTVQGRQIPSSSTASALKPTVSGSTNAFSVNCAVSSCDRSLRAGSHLGAHARVAKGEFKSEVKSEFKSEVIL